MAEQFQDMRQLQKQHRNNNPQSNGKKPHGKKPHGQKQNFNGNGKLTGKNITRFPVYLRNGVDRTEVRVCRHFDEVQQLLQNGGSWECLGPAPMDMSQALVNVDAAIQYSVTREFGVFRIIEIEGNMIRLFPTGHMEASTTWMEKFRPRVGAWVIRQNLNTVASRDSYVTISDKAFNYSYARFMDPEVLEEMKSQYNQVVELLEEKRQEEREARADAEAQAARAKDEAKAQIEDGLAESNDAAQVETTAEEAQTIGGDEPLGTEAPATEVQASVSLDSAADAGDLPEVQEVQVEESAEEVR